jgi:hypothetical protein
MHDLSASDETFGRSDLGDVDRVWDVYSAARELDVTEAWRSW